MKKLVTFVTFLIIAVLFAINYSSSNLESTNSITTKKLRYKIISSYPHDTNSFTQGLIFSDGFLYESTGLYGKSTLRKLDLNTGEVLREVKLQRNHFAEGITVLDNKVYQLTWKSRKGFVYDIKQFDLIENFSYSTEGWGLTNDERNLIMSDGSSYLYFLDPVSFETVRQIRVKDLGEPVNLLNELEYINGKIYSNIWRSNKIISIDPDSGKVIEWIDLSGLLEYDKYNSKIGVLNGIAYDKSNKRLFVTGKYWPKIFEIELL